MDGKGIDVVSFKKYICQTNWFANRKWQGKMGPLKTFPKWFKGSFTNKIPK